ncbi:beta-propeller fold lactonase family protein [Calidithermus chliarophilus]|uniref:beta-propeller fold lactonase family protein n=1 Tax=Calidithermus chliarophilus TaxID=52023 RepID=UPI000A053E45|nr:beta-propeller fold lactonase family protein [Calidithermus chliarophilus]
MDGFVRILASAAVLVGAGLALGTATEGSKGVQVYLDSLPLSGTRVDQGVTLVPVRALAQASGAGLQWDASRKAATLTRGPDRLVLQAGSKRALLNGSPLELKTPAQAGKDGLLVPAQAVAGFLGLQAYWIPEQRALALLSGIPKVYVANEYSDSVSVINARTNRKIKDIRLEGPGAAGHGGAGDGEDHKDAKVIPHNIQVSPDGRYVYTANAGTNSLGVIDAYTDTPVAEIRVGEHPAHVVVSRDNRTAFVTNGGEGTVSVVDLRARKVRATIPVGKSPHGLRISPDGREVYVANTQSDSVTVIDVASLRAVAEVAVLSKPAQVGFTPDGRYVYASNAHLGEDVQGHVSVIDTATRQAVGNVAVGKTPIQVYVTPDGRFVYVANTGSNDVSVIETASGSVVKTIPAGKAAHGVVISPDGRFVYVSNTEAGTVTVIEVARQAVVATVPAAYGANGISYRAGR